MRPGRAGHCHTASVATSKVRPLGQIGTSRDRWRVRFSNGVIALIVLGLALVVRIHEAYGTIEEDELQDMEHAP